MQESHRKGLAHHPDPESCVGCGREAPIEALTGARAGRVLSCEIIHSRVPTVYWYRKATLAATPLRAAVGLCAVRDPGMFGYSTRENRETSGPSVVDVGGGPGGEGLTPHAHHGRF